jgi:hypothetical protein
MSHRVRSIVTSPFFMTDPVPISKDDDLNMFYDTEDPFVIKGHDTPFKIFEASPDEEPQIIHTEEGSFIFKPKELRDALQELEPVFPVPIKKLSTDYQEKFAHVVESLKLAFVDSVAHTKALNVIQSICPSNTENIRPGSVGSFFCGCLCHNANNSVIPLSCTAHCNLSIPFPHETHGIKECEYSVLLYITEDRQFYSLLDRGTSTAYIYVDTTNNAFTQDNINRLRDAGITDIILVRINDDNTYDTTNMSEIPVDSLLVDDGTNNINNTEAIMNTTTTTTTDNTVGGIVFAVILIILALLLLIVIYRSYNNRR